MAVTYERVTLAAPAVVTLVDRFAQLRGTRGAFPGPLGTARLSFIARIDQGNVVPLDPVWRLRAESNGDSVYRFREDADVAGRLPLRVPPARYRLRIDSDFYQRLEVDLDWPAPLNQTPTLLLLPGYAYPFPDLTLPRTTFTVLRGSLFEVGGGPAPVEGAVVSITAPVNTWPFATCRTDAGGGWAVVVPTALGDPPLAVTLHIAGAGNPLDVDLTLQPRVENVLPQTALRGSVQRINGVPIRGAEVHVGSIAQEAVTDGDGAWVFYFPLDQADAQVQVTVTTPNGQSQSQFVDVVNRATVVVSIFSFPMS